MELLTILKENLISDLNTYDYSVGMQPFGTMKESEIPYIEEYEGVKVESIINPINFIISLGNQLFMVYIDSHFEEWNVKPLTY